MDRTDQDEIKQAHALLTAALAYYDGIFLITECGAVASINDDEMEELIEMPEATGNSDRFSNLADGCVIFYDNASFLPNNLLATLVYGGTIDGAALVMSGTAFSKFCNEREKRGIK